MRIWSLEFTLTFIKDWYLVYNHDLYGAENMHLPDFALKCVRVFKLDSSVTNKLLPLFPFEEFTS